MNTALKEIFTRMKPVCDVMMVNPSKENVAGYISIVNELGDEHIQELQQYLLYPLITHIRSRELKYVTFLFFEFKTNCFCVKYS